MTAQLKVQGLEKIYTSQPILQGIDLEVNRGEIHVLLGASGSGKSTLLKCLNLLETPTVGKIQIDEFLYDFSRTENPKTLLKTATELRKKVGMVFQSFNLWPHLTVLQNLTLAPMQVLGQKKKTAIEDAHIMLNKVGLTYKADVYPRELSGGQQQRVAIARALVMRPEILLFDEPTSALDPENVKDVLNVMQELAETHQMTMLIATHEIGFAKNVASHALFLEHGKILEQGYAKEILSLPKTESLQRFLSAVYH